MKRLMNRRDVSRFHKFLSGGMAIEKISKAMNVELNTLKKFLPADVAKSNDAKAKVAKAAVSKGTKSEEKADTAKA